MRRIGIPLRRHVGALVVLALVAALVVMAAVGTGYHPRTAEALDGGAWLGSANGSVVHANGTSARVDWLLTAGSRRFDVIQDGTGGLLDDSSGVARAIDGSAMTLSKPTDLGGGNPTLVLGGGRAYVVFRASGTVQPVDPSTLVATGQAVTVGDPIGSVAVDATGVAYVVITPSGTIDTLDGGSIQAQISGGSPDGRLVSVAGSVVEVDARTGAVVSLQADGQTRTVALGLPGDSNLAIPTAIASSTLWLTDTSAGTAVGIDPGRGLTTQIPLGVNGSTVSAPQSAGGDVFVEDAATGTVLVVDPVTRAVTRHAVFPVASAVTFFAKDGLVWGNDFARANAVVADRQGTVQVIEKYRPGKNYAGPGPRPAHRPVPKVRHKPVAKNHKAPKKTKKAAKKPKKKQKKKAKAKPARPRAPTTLTTIAPLPPTTLPLCPTTTTGPTSSTVVSTTTTAPCQTSPTTTVCPTTTSTSSTSTTTTQPDTTTITQPDTTTTTSPCPTTTTSSTTTTTTVATTTSGPPTSSVPGQP